VAASFPLPIGWFTVGACRVVIQIQITAMFKWELRRIGVDLISSPQLHFPSLCSMFPDMQNLLVVA
jgi:hypothetical protein